MSKVLGKNIFSHNLTYDKKTANLIYIYSDNMGENTEIIKNYNKKALMLSYYKNSNVYIKSIKKSISSINDLKLVEDILQFYPEFQQVIFNKVINMNRVVFDAAISKLADKHQNVIFICIDEGRY